MPENGFVVSAVSILVRQRKTLCTSLPYSARREVVIAVYIGLLGPPPKFTTLVGSLQEAINDVSRDRCKSGHRAGWGPYSLDAAFDPAPEADGGRGASTRCCPAS